MTLASKVWRDTMSRLQQEIPDFAFAAWISPLAVKFAGDRVVLGCPSSFHRDRVRNEYHDALERNLRAAAAAGQVDALTVASFDASFDASPDRPPYSTIDLVCMGEFLEVPGEAISAATAIVASPSVVRSAGTAQATSPVMKAAAAQQSVQVGQIQGSVAVSSHALTPAAALTPATALAVDETAQAPQPQHLSSVPERRLGMSDKSRAGSKQGAAASTSKPRTKKTDPAQTELPFSFESFVVGPCNALAREAALALARTRQQSLNLLYLAGESGMGKTHLARATAAESRRHSGASAPSLFASPHAEGFPGLRAPSGPGSAPPSGPRSNGARDVVFTSAEQFTTEFVSAMRNGRSDEFKRRYRGPIGLLVVEDIQFFSGRVKTQLELFHTLTHVLDAGGRVLLTGDRSPRELTGLDPRMQAQVGRGFVAELEAPDAVVRRHILRTKASAGGVRLPADCLDLLVEATQGSVRDIESMLIQVVTTSSLLGRKIDLGLTEEAIALKSSAHSALTPKTVAVSEIVRIVAAFFGKRPELLAAKSRRRDVLIPRQLAMYLAHRYTEASFAEIGRGLGRGHPSVRNAVERIERQVLENAPVRYQVEALSERIDQTIKDQKG